MFYKYAAPTALVLRMTVRQIQSQFFQTDDERFPFSAGNHARRLENSLDCVNLPEAKSN
jgi:hypothetical protein